ncbi:7310_t:CDS:2, partial [Ambispora gerdemannii]
HTLPFCQFWLWIETAGAKSYNRISQQTFQELVDYDYGEVHPTIIHQRILINFVYKRFVGTHTNEQNNSDNEDPEENNSNEYYSETIDAGTQTEGSDEERRSKKSIEDGNLIDFFSSENSHTDDEEEIIYIEETIINEDNDTSQTDEEQDDEPEQRESPSHEQENMVNVNDVLNASGYPARTTQYNRWPITCSNCGQEGHISTGCSKSIPTNSYQQNRGNGWQDRNNANNRNSHLQNNTRPNASSGSANNGQINNNTNTALLIQIQQLTDALQNGTEKEIFEEEPPEILARGVKREITLSFEEEEVEDWEKLFIQTD